MDLTVLQLAKAEPAVPGGDEAGRQLSEKGQRDACRLGRWMRELDLALDLVATSPHAHARETAALELRCESTPPPLEAWEELGPDGAAEVVLARLAALDAPGAGMPPPSPPRP